MFYALYTVTPSFIVRVVNVYIGRCFELVIRYVYREWCIYSYLILSESCRLLEGKEEWKERGWQHTSQG